MIKFEIKIASRKIIIKSVASILLEKLTIEMLGGLKPYSR